MTLGDCNMIYYLITIGVFLLYIIYDINSFTINSKILNKLFIIGTLIFVTENLFLVNQIINDVEFNFTTIYLLTCALIFFVLLIYTLFFSLPFKDTYLDQNQANKVIRTGMYGLSRHIGVLWFILMYACLAGAFTNLTFTVFAIVACLMNLIYIVFQDNYTFIRLFDDYEDYKTEVSFLIPSPKAIIRVISRRR